MHDVVEFLRGLAPFDAVDDHELATVAAAAEVELHPAGSVIVTPDGQPLDVAFLVRHGAVELLEGGQVRDLLGEGELFGYASMLAEEPVGYTAQAAEPCVLLRFPERTVRPLLERPEAVRFLVRSLAPDGTLLVPRRPAALAHRASRAVRELVRAPALVCRPETSVREAAGRMVERGVSYVLVDADDGLGIVTDEDLRTRVLAADAGLDTPLAAVMSAPAHTVAADRLGDEALLEMLDRGVRHLPVLDARRRLIGVLDDVDLMASERRGPFRLREAIARAADATEAAREAAGRGAVVVDLQDARVGALTICRVIASIHDTLVRRLVDLAQAEAGLTTSPFAWLALGSFARREAFPASDSESALVWEGEEGPEAREALHGLAERVLAGLSASGIAPSPEGALASRPLFARSLRGWQRSATQWAAEPDGDRRLVLLSVALESAPVWGDPGLAAAVGTAFATASRREETLRRLGAEALALRPPTGFLRDFVLERSGERRGVLDIKRGGLLPIVNLARWAALSAGVAAASTPARLEAAERARVLSATDADVLREAFELVCALRMEHQAERLRAGLPPDDLIDPTALAPLTRRALKNAFRAVARVQRGCAVALGLSPR